jgi:hypothetical protein
MDRKLQFESFKAQGSAFLFKMEYSHALMAYDSALFTAENDDEKSLVFANKSLVYLKLKMFKHCLSNIQLAIDHGYSAEKMPKLKQREEACRKAMENQKPVENLWNFFKLSLPPHPKIPFDCLEVRQSRKLGRGIYTNRDLNPGDVIAVEQTFMPYQTNPRSKILRCLNCVGSNKLDLLPSRSDSTKGETLVCIP